MFRKFDYYKADSLDEATSILMEEKTKILAGGTDVFVEIRSGSLRPKKLVDIKGIKGLNEIKWDNNYLSIGALVTINDILKSKEIQEHYPILIDAGKVFGCHAIRNRATIGGNIANGSPGAEYGSPFVVLEAKVVVYGKEGYKEIPIDKFYIGAGKVDLKEGEIITSFLIPKYSYTKGTYIRRSRVKGMDLAGLNVAVLAINADNPKEREIRIGMGAVSKVPMRAFEVEKFLYGKEITQSLLNEVKEMLKLGIAPRATSLRASPEYKKKMVGVLTEIAFENLRIKKC